MLGPDVFAVLIPRELRSIDAFRHHPTNQPLRVPLPADNTICDATGCDSQATTEGPEELDPESRLEKAPNLLLRFNDRLKHPAKGWMFGRDRYRCDVVLDTQPPSNKLDVSQTHFYITVDNRHRILLRDESKFGTSVTLDGQNREEVRNQFTWTLALEPGQQYWKEIIISIRGISFEVVFPHHETANQEYVRNMARFVATAAAVHSSLPIGALGIGSGLITMAPSEKVTAGREKARYVVKTPLGIGGFGIVRQVIDLQNGELYAVKEPIRAPKPMEVAAFKREVQLMTENEHPNIVKVIGFESDPLALLMEFYPYGSLHNQRLTPDSINDIVSVLCQVSVGLEYMHSRNFVHRDLKPRNILVKSVNPLCIAIADFGFAKSFEEYYMSTVCGTPTYTAPEMISRRYIGPPVDIWSTGIMILQFLNGIHVFLTNDFDEVGTVAEKYVLPAVVKLGRAQHPLARLLSGMLDIDPTKRTTAHGCLVDGLRYHLFQRSGAYYVNHERYGGPRPPVSITGSMAEQSFDLPGTGPNDNLEFSTPLEANSIQNASSPRHGTDRPPAESESLKSDFFRVETGNVQTTGRPAKSEYHTGTKGFVRDPDQYGKSQTSTFRQNNSGNINFSEVSGSPFNSTTKRQRSQESNPRLSKLSQAPSRRPISPSQVDQRPAASRGALPSNYTPRVTRSAAAAEGATHQPYPMPPIKGAHGVLKPESESHAKEKKSGGLSRPVGKK